MSKHPTWIMEDLDVRWKLLITFHTNIHVNLNKVSNDIYIRYITFYRQKFELDF